MRGMTNADISWATGTGTGCRGRRTRGERFKYNCSRFIAFVGRAEPLGPPPLPLSLRNSKAARPAVAPFRLQLCLECSTAELVAFAPPFVALDR